MNKNNAAEYLPLVQALAEGKTIQIFGSENKWVDVYNNVNFSYASNKYRIKPEPAVIYALLRKEGSLVQSYSTKALAVRDCAAINEQGNSRHKPYRVAKMVEVPDESC